MINIKTIVVPKSSGGGSTTSTTVINSGGSGSRFQPHYLWGQYFDDTKDIDGDLLSKGTISGVNINGENVRADNIYASNNIEADGNINGYNINADGTITGFNIVSDNMVTANMVDANSANIDTINSTTGNITNINSTTGNIITLNSNTITSLVGNIDNVYSESVDTEMLSALCAYIGDIDATNITTEYLTVTKAAHFFKLRIDEIKASKGMIIVSPANAKLDDVEVLGNGNYRCYFRCKDPDTLKEIYNSFEVGDQIISQTFNAATGISYNVSTNYYWRLCVGVGTGVTRTINDQIVECHYIDLSSTDCDSHSTTPKAGDEVVLLGNRTSANRQNAILISAYDIDWIDKGDTTHSKLHAPLIAQYKGINTYNLTSFRWSVISKDLNLFRGDFALNSGQSIEDAISNYSTTYVHIAYANSADGSQDFSKTNTTNNYSYIGFCSNTNESDAGLTYRDYNWSRYKGSNGQNAVQYKIVDNGSYAQVRVEYDNNNHVVIGSDGLPERHIDIYFNVNIYKIDGNTSISPMSQTEIATNSFEIIYRDNNTSWHNAYASNYIQPDSNGVMSLTLSNQRYSSTIKYYQLGLYNTTTDKYIDTLKVPLLAESQATFDVINDVESRITATVTGVANDVATLSLRADGIDTRVTNNTNSISTISQKADNIELSITNGLTQTGIDIENKKITIQANNFYIYNNYGDRLVNVDSNGNLILTGILRPKNIQWDYKEFASTPYIDGNMSTDDMYYAYIQNTPNTQLVNATVRTNGLCRLVQSKICIFEMNSAQGKDMFEYTRDYQNKHRYKVTTIASGTMPPIDSFNVEYYDEHGDILIDPEDIYEMRIVRSNGSDVQGWNKFMNMVVNKLQYGRIYEDENLHDWVWLDPEVSSTTYIQSGTSMSFLYSTSDGYDTWDVPYDISTALYESIEEYESGQRNRTQTLSGFKLYKATEHEYSEANTGTYKTSLITYDTTATNMTGTQFNVKAILNELYTWNDVASNYGFCELELKFERISTNDVVNVTIKPTSNSYEWTEDVSNAVTSVSFDTSNFRNSYVSFSNIEGRYKFSCGYNSSFWNRNNQLMYYYYMNFYCSGIYDVRTHVDGIKYNDTYNDENKQIYAFLVLPTLNGRDRNSLVGTEIKIIGDTNSNVFLAAPSGYNLEYIKNGSWSWANSFSEYSNISTENYRSQFYKIPAGITRVMCVPYSTSSIKWIIG